MRVMALGAHPDDVEICCGGTLARYSQEGSEVMMVSLTNGDKGHDTLPPEEIAAIRKKEFESSAAVIGAQAYCLGVLDEFLLDDVETRLALVDVIRSFRPDLLITHDPSGCHVDHRIASKLVFEAASLSYVTPVKTEHPAHPPIMPIYFMDTIGGVGFAPEEFVDISDTFAIKKEMLLHHESQIKAMGKRLSASLVDIIEITGRFRGLQAGVEYAEAFRPLRAALRVRTERLLP